MQTNQKLSIKEKLKIFKKQIRQQKRDTYRQKAREYQFNFFSSIGVTDIQEDQMMSFVMEEEQKMTVQQFKIDDEGYEKMIFQEKEKIYKIIEEYRWKDFEHELGTSEYLKNFHKNGRKFIDEENLSKEETCWDAIQKDLDALLIILSKQIFLNDSDRTVQRNFLLEVLRLIALWIHRIFTILGPNYRQFAKITDLASAIVELLIGFELKSQKLAFYQSKLRTSNHNTQAETLWENRELFEEVMSLSFAYKRWTFLQHALSNEIKIYSIIIISTSIEQRHSMIKSCSKTQFMTENMEILFDLIYSYRIIFQSLIRRQCIWNACGDESESGRLIRLSVINAQQAIESVTKTLMHLEKSDIGPGKDLEQMIPATIDQLLFIQRSSEKAYLYLMDRQEMNESVKEALQYLAQFRQQLRQNSIVVFDKNKSLVLKVIDQAFEDKKQAIQTFKLHYITVKLRIYNQLLIWTSAHKDANSNNQNENLFNKSHQNMQVQQIFKQLKQKVALKAVLRLESSLSIKSLTGLLLEESEQILSLNHLEQIILENQYENRNLTYQLLRLVQLLLLQLQARCEHFQKIISVRPKTEESQHLEASIICQIRYIATILNAVAQIDQKNVFKHGYLLAQLTVPNQNKSRSKSLFDYFDFIFSQLMSAKCGNSKDFSVKNQLGFLIQNLVYYCFPLQSHFDDFQPDNKQESISKANHLVQCLSQTPLYKNEQLYAISKSQIEYLFSESSLDKQTDTLLQVCSKLMQQKSVEAIRSGIKICQMILESSPTLQVFKYFKNFIKSSTKIYLKLEQISQTHQHQKVSGAALRCIGQIDDGEKNFRDDQCNNGENDVQI